MAVSHVHVLDHRRTGLLQARKEQCATLLRWAFAREAFEDCASFNRL